MVPARGAHTAPARALAPRRRSRPRDSVRRRARSPRAEGLRVAVSLRGACTESRHDARRRRPRMTLRRPVWALYALVVGLAIHNFVMAMLWRAGVRGGALTVISAWKEVVLLVALALVVADRRTLPFSRTFVPDLLALAFAAFVVVYALIPQSLLDGGATHKGIAYGLRHDLLIVGAYFLGRGLQLTDKERAWLCHVVLATAAFVALFGLVDVYGVSLV